MALIWTPPFPTTPKLAPVPSAMRPGVWGDHFTQVNEVGSLTPYCLNGLYIWFITMINLAINYSWPSSRSFRTFHLSSSGKTCSSWLALSCLWINLSSELKEGLISSSDCFITDLWGTKLRLCLRLWTHLSWIRSTLSLCRVYPLFEQWMALNQQSIQRRWCPGSKGRTQSCNFDFSWNQKIVWLFKEPCIPSSHTCHRVTLPKSKQIVQSQLAPIFYLSFS